MGPSKNKNLANFVSILKIVF